MVMKLNLSGGRHGEPWRPERRGPNPPVSREKSKLDGPLLQGKSFCIEWRHGASSKYGFGNDDDKIDEEEGR